MNDYFYIMRLFLALLYDLFFQSLMCLFAIMWQRRGRRSREGDWRVTNLPHLEYGVYGFCSVTIIQLWELLTLTFSRNTLLNAIFTYFPGTAPSFYFFAFVASQEGLFFFCPEYGRHMVSVQPQSSEELNIWRSDFLSLAAKMSHGLNLMISYPRI
jgi:hypothetical protein